jgi:hypothetical protein
VPGGARKGKNGPPPFQPTDEQVGTAKYLIGRQQYPHKVASALVRKYKADGLTTYLAYRVMDAAREQVVQELSGQGHDPMAALFMFYQSVVADGTQRMQHRLNAADGIRNMLGLDRLLKKMDAGGVEAYLARLAGVQAARAGVVESAETVPEPTKGEKP